MRYKKKLFNARLLAVAVIGLLGFMRVSDVIAKPIPGGTLNPLCIPKYMEPLVIPPPMPRTPSPADFSGDYYEISVRQFRQQILPAGMPNPTFAIRTQKRSFLGICLLETIDFTGVDFKNGL